MTNKLVGLSEIQLSLGSNVFALNAKTGPTPLTKHFNMLWTQTTRSPDTATICRAMLQYAILSNAMTRLVLHKHPAILASPTLLSLDPPSKSPNTSNIPSMTDLLSRSHSIFMPLIQKTPEEDDKSPGATSTQHSGVGRQELTKSGVAMFVGFPAKEKAPKNNAAIDVLTDIVLKHMEAKLDPLMDILKGKILEETG
ncbi:hypothetical protein FGSG_13375 [Fusarium graminearum PH-1]|uniref:Chromosome 2, complete genome n=1 Tax=Gibberella zeae (strain ATCC MYA-4620 / CBS 123657 / FGSC 9075 / NRRL 31084 / PH-1) TaxID=229533 RepID=I1S945_GIBZE|nr:hypothetical protein FGSG_13375 [Fusarium graminearum PH-1]ESU14991.1 hypothetical protein FGSG_13375 [Fusarium graminearum PH-1]CEF76687.1 unnamed protein product [Fusarium graminearum]|eukprot:XP_011320416.1 hypothetical protein FGSG_13375 [Fusarium graminearum PH-1]